MIFYKKLINEFVERFSNNGRVSICIVDKILELSQIYGNSSSAQAREILTKLHCVDFSDMSDELVAKIPHYLNMVFSGGRYTYPWDKEKEQSKASDNYLTWKK